MFASALRFALVTLNLLCSIEAVDSIIRTDTTTLLDTQHSTSFAEDSKAGVIRTDTTTLLDTKRQMSKQEKLAELQRQMDEINAETTSVAEDSKAGVLGKEHTFNSNYVAYAIGAFALYGVIYVNVIGRSAVGSADTGKEGFGGPSQPEKPIEFKPVSLAIGACMLFGVMGLTYYVAMYGDFLDTPALAEWAEVCSAFACGVYIFCGLLFGCFFYVLDPNLFFMAPNLFNFGRDLVFGQQHKYLDYNTHANMMRKAIASVDDPYEANNGDKYTNGVAANAILAITIKLRAECLYWWTIAVISAAALCMDLKHRVLLHAFHAIFGFNIMFIDFNHWLPGSLGVPFPFGHNNHVTGIGRFIGWSLGPLWLPTGICALIAMYHGLK